jgi:hypothetical protein
MAMPDVVYVSPSMTPETGDADAVRALVNAGTYPPAASPVQDVSPVIKVARETDGSFLVSDRDDQAVGTGSTLEQAEADFRVSLVQRIRYLRTNLERLHPRLVQSLRRLERDFPWV